MSEQSAGSVVSDAGAAAAVVASEMQVSEKANATPSAESGEPAPDTEPPRTYTQDDLDRIVNKVKKNERYRTKKEIEAYYTGKLEGIQPPAQPQQQAKPEDTAPVRDKFDSYEEFIEAKAVYAGRKAARDERMQMDRETQAHKVERENAERAKSFQSKVHEKYPDLPERLEAIAHVPLPDGVVQSLAESAVGVDILNHFAENTKDFERIASLSPSAALREIGKLEARYESAKADDPAPASATVTEIKKPSSAPRPIKPVGGSVVNGDEMPSTNNAEAWTAWRNRQLLKKQARTK